MKNKLFALFLLAALAGLATSCVETVDGRSEMGVPFVKDTVEGRYQRPLAQVVDAARAVVKFNGQLVGDNSVNNSIEGKVNQESVYIRADSIDGGVTRVQVQTRTRAGGTDIDLAHELEKQIALQLVGR